MKALEVDPWQLNNIPDYFKTQKMCEFVPDWFMTQQ